MARSLLLALLVVIAATCAITVQAESDPASVGFSSDHAALSTYAAAASVRAGKMAAEFGKLAEQSIADGEAHAAKERKIRKAEADYAKSVADKKARDAAKRAARAARAARIAATRTRTFALSFDAPIATFTAEARTAIIADVSKLMGVDAGRVSIVKMAPTRADAQKTRIRFKVLAASAFTAPAAVPAKTAKAAKPKPKKAAKPAFQAPKPGKLGRRKGQQKLGVFVKPAAAAAPAPKKPAAQTPLAKSTKRALQSLAAALKAGAKADALKANKVNAASLNQQTKAERAATRAAKAAARVARRAAIKKSLVEFKLTRKNAKLALVKSLDAAKKSKADRAAALKAFNKETRKLRRALRRSLRGDRKRDPALRKLLQAFRVKAKDARRALRSTLAARPAKERKTKLRDLRRTQAQQRKDIIARFRRERKTARKQARKAAKAEIRTTKVAAAAVKAAATAAAAPAAPKSSFMELLSQQDAEVPEWPAHNRRDNVGERVRILASGKPRQYKQRDASQAKYIKLLPKHTAAESYAEHFQEWTRPKPAVTRRTVAQIKRKKFLGAAKKQQPAATKPIVPKLAPLPAPAAVVPVPQSLTPAAAKTAAKSSVPQTATVEAKSVSWWSPWHICIVVMSGIAFMGLVAGLAVWIRRNKSDRAPQELYAAV